MITKLAIFGITGDLSRRKLLPALEAINRAGEADSLEVIGVSRREVDLNDLMKNQPRLIPISRMVSVDMSKKTDYEKLKNDINLKPNEQLLIYLSVPPMAATQIVDFLGEVGLNSENVKLMFEKPFGLDLDSAKEVISRTSRYFKEEQIYRIDHYLAKEMAQNIIAFRGGNAIFSNIWNSENIEKIEVIASEEIGVEGRFDFYEQTGALRDLVQGHLMQLLALVLMDIPKDFDWSETPTLRKKALDFIQPANPKYAVRGQYEGYLEESGFSHSEAETFAKIRLESQQPRWKDVQICLVTGKALARKTTEIKIHLRKHHEAQSNQIIFRIQPNEGIDIKLYSKKPGYGREFEENRLKFEVAEDIRLPDAYEQVIVDAMRGKKNLFTSGAEVIRSWEILHDIQQSWSMDKTPMVIYPKGSNWFDVA